MHTKAVSCSQGARARQLPGVALQLQRVGRMPDRFPMELASRMISVLP